MPRRSARKRKAADTAVAGGSAASKGKRKSAPVRDQTSPLASLLTSDALGRSLAFLDVPSLLRSEMTAKFVSRPLPAVFGRSSTRRLETTRRPMAIRPGTAWFGATRSTAIICWPSTPRRSSE